MRERIGRGSRRMTLLQLVWELSENPDNDENAIGAALRRLTGRGEVQLVDFPASRPLPRAAYSAGCRRPAVSGLAG